MENTPRTATINFKTDLKTKYNAQELSYLLGVPLGTMLHAYLRDFIRTESVYFSLEKFKQPQSPERIMDRLDVKDREILRTLLNKWYLKANFKEESEPTTDKMI